MFPNLSNPKLSPSPTTCNSCLAYHSVVHWLSPTLEEITIMESTRLAGKDHAFVQKELELCIRRDTNEQESCTPSDGLLKLFVRRQRRGFIIGLSGSLCLVPRGTNREKGCRFLRSKSPPP